MHDLMSERRTEMELRSQSRWARMFATCGLMCVAAACTTAPHRAPVEDRSAGLRSAGHPVSASASSASASPDAVKLLPGAENSGKPGYYTVRLGDTLIRIGLDNGQHWKDLARWNSLDKPNQLEVGQVLRVIAPGLDPLAASTRPVATARVDTRPLDMKSVPSSATATGPSASGMMVAPAAPGSATAQTAPASAARETDEEPSWSWPSAGAVVSSFDEGRVKGLVFGGKAGDAVLAAADGRVVYAGSGLRGYGNLIILKHNLLYLTAYAHNQTLMVKEDQTVRRGQKIAEMGSTDADGVKLHFEIRRQGKPIDPAKLLPSR